uniref:RpmI_0 protein n=1 Tax=Fopius arisanus TaxID=64838 RepID=A0A0C9R9E3_9HYME
MIPKSLMIRCSALNAGVHRLCTRRCYSTEVPSKTGEFDIATAEETPRYVEIITDEDRKEIMKKRLKSRLNESHRRMLQGVRPYDEDIAWFHETIRYSYR